MTAKAWIYGLMDPQTNEIRYVGKAKSPESRMRSHIRNAQDWDKSHKANWIKGLLENQMVPRLIILEETNDDKWQQDETKWITYGHTHKWPLTNMTAGGDGFHGMSAEIKAKIGAAHKGKTLSQKVRKLISERRKGVPTTLGRKHSTESRAKMSASRIGKSPWNKGKHSSKFSEAAKAGWLKRKDEIQPRDAKGKFVRKENRDGF